MTIAEELQRLHELHQQGALTDEEYARAKAAVLAGPQPSADPATEQMQAQLEEIAREQDVARIDREWDQQRERHMMTGTTGGEWVDGRYVGGAPYRYIPTKGRSMMTGGIAVIGGVVWMVFVTAMGGGAFALFGVVFIVFGVGTALWSYSKAEEYERAHAAYRSRRRAAMFGDDEQEAPQEADWMTNPPPAPQDRDPTNPFDQ